MKLIYTLLLISICSVCMAQSAPAPAPPETENQQASQITPQPAAQTTGGYSAPMTRADSLKMAINDMKKAFEAAGKLFAGKSDTISVLIPDIEYEDAGLSRLKESLGKIKGAKSVSMQYSGSTARLSVSYKGKPSDLWDNVPADVRGMFKLLEAGERNLLLKGK